jgi:pimeloyl-ACP methyl ester carboxylesterase
MTRLARALSPTYRVIAVDLRGHGLSGDGRWNWTDVLADLDAVVADLRLGAPAVVGMSLGGMIATLWADTHPGGPGAVSLDGNPTPSRPDQLAGLDAATAARELDRLRSMFDTMAAMLAAPIDEDQITAARAGQRAMADQYGDDEDAWVEGFDRSLVERGGETFLRPDPATTGELRRAMAELDLGPAYRALRCPLLVVLATEDMPEQEPFHELYAAHRRFVATQLAAVDNDFLRLLPLARASHAMVAERPRELAELIVEFLASAH